jgi:crotonobetainyl-CoA:carnitine CoA-transferase CaiB-like acyl-CoA transferase
VNAPLKAMRIVDLGMFVAGPYASVPIGELGADIIKIEPLTGEPNRAMWRPFASCNRGKRSILLDLKNPEGIAIARKICTGADVVHHNFRPGVAERLGLGYADLSEDNPGLTYLEACAYGDTGPMAKLPGFDMMIQAMCGLEAHCGGEGNDPLWSRWAPVDFTGGYLSTIGILAGQYRKLRSGQGGRITTNLLDGGLFLFSELLRSGDGSVDGTAPMNAGITGSHPAQSLYQTADGWVGIVAQSDEQSTALARALNLQDGSSTPLSDWGEEMRTRIADAAAGFNSDELLTLLHEAGIWAEVCRDDFENTLFNSPAWRDSGLVRNYPHRGWGNNQQIGNCVRFSDMEPDLETAGRVPEAGEDTREILTEFGYTQEQIEDLYHRNIVA